MSSDDEQTLETAVLPTSKHNSHATATITTTTTTTTTTIIRAIAIITAINIGPYTNNDNEDKIFCMCHRVNSSETTRNAATTDITSSCLTIYEVLCSLLFFVREEMICNRQRSVSGMC